MKFIQRNVASSEYTINEYVHSVLRQTLKNNPWVLTLCHRQNLKLMYHHNKESCNIVQNSRMTKVLFHWTEGISV